MKKTVPAKARYQLRGDTEDNLSLQNPILKAKEPVLVLDENGDAVAFKIGNGVAAYTELPLHAFDISYEYAHSHFANALRNKAVGPVVSIYDASPFEQSASVKVITAAWNENMAVCRYGKNLATAQQVYQSANRYLETEHDGRNCVRFTSSSVIRKSVDVFKENTQYTISFDAKTICWNRPEAPSETLQRLIAVWYTDGTSTTLSAPAWEHDWQHFTFTTTYDKTVKFIGLDSQAWRVDTYVDVDTFQIEEGTQATEVEPYSAQFFAVEKDGSIAGGIPLAPAGITTLATNKKVGSWDMTLVVDYVVDISKELEKLTQAVISLGGNV